MGETIIEVWDRLKPYVVSFSAAVPLLVVITAALFGEAAWSFKISLSMIVFQLGFLIAISFETQRTLKGSGAKETGTYQISDNPFWQSAKGRKLRELRLFGLNGGRFAKEIDKYDMKIANIRAVFPSKEAVEHCFSQGPDGNSQNKINQIENGLAEFVQILELRKSMGKLNSFDVRRVNSFTYNFTALFNSAEAIMGAYFPDPSREASTGLKALSWLERDKEKIRAASDQFESIWKKLG